MHLNKKDYVSIPTHEDTYTCTVSSKSEWADWNKDWTVGIVPVEVSVHTLFYPVRGPDLGPRN